MHREREEPHRRPRSSTSCCCQSKRRTNNNNNFAFVVSFWISFSCETLCMVVLVDHLRLDEKKKNVGSKEIHHQGRSTISDPLHSKLKEKLCGVRRGRNSVHPTLHLLVLRSDPSRDCLYSALKSLFLTISVLLIPFSSALLHTHSHGRVRCPGVLDRTGNCD